ncbi:insulinase family protein [Serpentinicella sp. ANB-PHB4]|uniref:insulinase family protein n=1 Tax=Serpentinicella sp. ANB-PHB4 TaxID=3074076 RepID=UPI0028561D2A|nr:insulinase family protein [Serpentinicella sp. ANB-PHB4]MDR5659610.1 insulinase family protein [Serpentinicella sp. ANB-PHB4]
MQFEVGKIYSNFELQESKEVKELKGKSYLFSHIKSGARLLYIHNDDDNKVFSITFRTPPTDSTGLPHILEHSVLCGSRKFPTKDPFVELAKGSLNTFLNAMTFSDKTMYPIASRNSKDFINLMDVYLDAVFHPNIYETKEILMQEGWHHEIRSQEEEINYKGVVYNEMKGAFSSPDQVMFRKIQETLFPDTPYRFDSGGDPEVIPDLTYDQFIQYHKEYYHPVNSYIHLYGDGNILEHLEFIDQNYLKDFEKMSVNTDIPLQKSFDAPTELAVEYPISEKEKEADKTLLSLNFAVGKATDPELHLAFDILNNILLGSPAAPLKKALLEAGIGKDVFGSFDYTVLQPVLSVVSKNANETDKDKFKSTIHKTLTSLVENGIDKKLIEASINSYEFRLREADYGRYPKGLIYAMKSMESWLHDADPLMHLTYETSLEKIKKAFTAPYFEDLIKKYLLNNTHSSLLVVKPKKGLGKLKEEEVQEKLKQFKDSLSKEEIGELIKQTNALDKFQEVPNTPEELSSIPLLSLEDIEKDPETLKLVEKEEEGVKVLFHPAFTNEIVYLNALFDTRKIPQKLIPYVGLMSYILGKVSTETYSYEELSNEININTGGIYFNTEVYSDKNSDEAYYPMITLKSASLVRKLPELTKLISEVISKTKFDEEKRLKEIIQEVKSRLESVILNEGHIVAAKRATSYFSSTGMIQEMSTGISFYEFIADLDENFDQRVNELKENFDELTKLIFNKQNLIFNVTTAEKDYIAFKENINNITDVLNTSKIDNQNYQFEKQAKNEGMLTSSKIQYVAKAYNFRKLGFEYTGYLQVLKTIISLDYLWKKVRVSGGAYGAMAGFSRNGNMYFTSYRDPNLDKTLSVYDNAWEYIKHFKADEREMTKYIIGTISKIDAPLSPAAKGERAVAYYISGITENDLKKERTEILNTNEKDIQELSELVKAAMKQNNFCALGNENKIKQQESVFSQLVDVFN